TRNRETLTPLLPIWRVSEVSLCSKLSAKGGSARFDALPASNGPPSSLVIRSRWDSARDRRPRADGHGRFVEPMNIAGDWVPESLVRVMWLVVAGRSIAPLGASPAVTERHKAISRLGANATIMVLRL